MNSRGLTVKDFIFTTDDGIVIKESVNIPPALGVNFRELGHRIIEKESIPCYSEQRLLQELRDFIEDSIEEVEDEYFSDQSNREERLQQFSDVFDDICEKKRAAEEIVMDDKKAFWEKYHELIHSGYLTEPLVSLENSFSLAITDMIACRNQALTDMASRQTQEMEKMLQSVGVNTTEEDVNVLSLRHFEQSEKQRLFWETSINDLKKSQKEEFMEWIEKVYEDVKNETSKDHIISRIRSRTDSSFTRSVDMDRTSISASASSNELAVSMDESFTINLGAQMKTTHNLRLTSTSVLSICSNMSDTHSTTPSPQRIQTAMSLYSNSLTGLILLVDNRVNNYTGVKKEFSDISEQSADFHFPNFDEQLRVIRDNLSASRADRSSNLQVGDFYLTKHSNLSQVHVVFHLVSDEGVLSSDINSRHSIMLGLRNVLKTAYMSDVSTLSLPLLLSYEMMENMTLPWCLKRAELVFKCVKGFMIEMASLSPHASENRTLQFVVPENISEELFSNLATMLPSIFRLSNPLILSESV